MANQFINTQLVSNTALAMFANNAPFVMTGSRIYQDDFQNSGYKIGDTLQVRDKTILLSVMVLQQFRKTLSKLLKISLSRINTMR